MPFQPSFGLIGAELFDLTEEMSQIRRRIVEEISSAFVHGTIQWRKDLGHPLVVDFGRAFFATLAITQSFNDGDRPPPSFQEYSNFYFLLARPGWDALPPRVSRPHARHADLQWSGYTPLGAGRFRRGRIMA